MIALSGTERRTEPRIEPALCVTVTFPGRHGRVEETAVLRDLSVHGMYLRTPRPAPYGGPVRARFLLGGTHASLAEGRVVRTEDGRGLAVELVRVGSAVRAAIADLAGYAGSLAGIIDAHIEIHDPL